MSRLSRGARVTAIAACVTATMMPSAPGAAAASVSPKAWARAVCDASGEWTRSIERAAAAVDGVSATTSDEIKSALRRFMKAATKATSRYLARVEDAGSPSTRGGRAAADALRAGIEDARTQMAATRSAVVGAPTADPAAFAQTAATARVELDAVLLRLQETLAVAPELTTPALAKAFRAERRCVTLVRG